MMLRSKSTHLSLGQVASLQPKTHYKSTMIGKTSIISTALAIAFGSISMSAGAAGLGRLSVQSALGQPLRAEVEVTALGKDEASGVTAKLAPAEAFKQAGLEYNPALANLRFVVEKRPDGRHVVKITSNQPINEPFVDLMVELNWPTGRFVREYTFLLDPADLKIASQTVPGTEARVDPVVPPSPVATAPVAAAPAPVSVAQTPVASPAPTERPKVPEKPMATASAAKGKAAPAKAAAPAPKAAPAQAQNAAGSYDVKRGDTLARIAARNKPASVTLEQAIVSIYRANPSAFMGNINRLKANVPLAIPDESAMGAVSVAEAKQEVRFKTAGFKNYKTRLASAAKSAPKTAKSTQSAEGKITAGVVDSTPKAAAGDVVKLSKGSGKAGAGTNALGSAEAKAARDNALAEANSRVQALEKNVSDLQKLLAVKDQQLADAEKRAKAAAAATAAAASAAAGKVKEGVIEKAPTVAKNEAKTDPAPIVPPIVPPKVSEPAKAPEAAKPVEAPKAPEAAKPVEAPKAPEATKPVETAKPAEPPKPVEAAKPIEPNKPAEVAKPAETSAPAEPPKPPVVAETPKPAVKAPAPPVVADKGFIGTITDEYPWALPLLGGLALAGGGYGIYAMNRRRKSEKFEDSLMEGEAFSANSLFGTTGGQNVDTSAALSTSAAASSTKAESGVEVGSTEVDPIAEAEVYIAYGREGQAEEILKEALRKQGDRQAIRLKLCEIYASRKDVASFEATAKEMHSMTRGKNEEWPKVVTLGLSIDPANSLYTGAEASKSVVGTATAAATGLAAMTGTAALAGKSSIKNAGDTAIDSLQNASQIVPAIPDFMADTSFGNTKQLAPNTQDSPVSLDFDFDQSTITKAAEKAAAAPAAEKTMAHLDLPSLDLPAKSAKANVETSAKMDPMDFSIDLPALEALTGNGGKPASTQSHGIDFGNTATATAAPNTQSAAWQEMATKLDLAAAYEEIGDKDGARELLEEVAKGGDPAQQQKAKSMMAKLG
jgi:pilus assembly protein FimV